MDGANCSGLGVDIRTVTEAPPTPVKLLGEADCVMLSVDGVPPFEEPGMVEDANPGTADTEDGEPYKVSAWASIGITERTKRNTTTRTFFIQETPVSCFI